MADSASTNKQDKVRAIYDFAEDLLRQGHTKLEVEKALAAKGMAPDLAGEVVERVVKRKTQARQSRASRPKLVLALIVLVFGFAFFVKGLTSPVDYGEIAKGVISIFLGAFWLFNLFRDNYRG
jgi:hypothetical protein